MSTSAARAANVSQHSTEAPQGRNFQSIDVDALGTNLLISECTTSPDRSVLCSILRYNVISKQLHRYIFQDDKSNAFATFTKDGGSIIISRHFVNITSGGTDVSSEISVSALDGTKWKNIANVNGVVSDVRRCDASNTIVYWKGLLQATSSRHQIGRFDVWEYDPTSGIESLFAGRFEFFDHASIRCISQGQLLVAADGPRELSSDIGKYWKRFNRSSVYLLTRGNTTLPEPTFTRILGASIPFASKEPSAIYVYGEDNGIFIFKYSGQKEIARFKLPDSVGGLGAIAGSANGSKIYFIYQMLDAKSTHDNGIIALDTESGVWSPVSIPSISGALAVTFSK